jgi:MFS family permease
MGGAGLATFAVSPLVGTLADRFGGRRALVAGVLLSIALWPLPAVVPGLIGLGITWALVSGLAGGVFALFFSVLADAASAGVRGRVMALSDIPSNAAYVLGPGLGILITRAGIFAVFPAGAALTALGLVALIVVQARVDAPVRRGALPSVGAVAGTA